MTERMTVARACDLVRAASKGYRKVELSVLLHEDDPPEIEWTVCAHGQRFTGKTLEGAVAQVADEPDTVAALDKIIPY